MTSYIQLFSHIQLDIWRHNVKFLFTFPDNVDGMIYDVISNSPTSIFALHWKPRINAEKKVCLDILSMCSHRKKYGINGKQPSCVWSGLGYHLGASVVAASPWRAQLLTTWYTQVITRTGSQHSGSFPYISALPKLRIRAGFHLYWWYIYISCIYAL